MAGVYPIKRVNWEKARTNVDSGRPTAPSAALDYVLEIEDPDHVTSVNGFTRVRYAGTGFLMIRRQVLEKMCEHPDSRLAAIFPRTFSGRARGKPQPVCIVRLHDRCGARGLISARISPSANAGPISAAKSGLISKAASIMSARRCSMAMCRRSSPHSKASPRAVRPTPLELATALSSDFPGGTAPTFPRYQEFPMQTLNEQTGIPEPLCADRIGFAKLTTTAFRGIDLRPLRDALIAKVVQGTAGPGDGLDLSLIAQLLGDKQTGLAIQAEVLAFHQLFRSPCAVKSRSCAFSRSRPRSTWAATRRSNFCWRVRHRTNDAYVISGSRSAGALPDHDVAIVIASDSEECRDALDISIRSRSLAAADAQSATARLQSGSRQAASLASRYRRT